MKAQIPAVLHFRQCVYKLQPTQMEEGVGLLLYKCTLDDFLRTKICSRPRLSSSLQCLEASGISKRKMWA